MKISLSAQRFEIERDLQDKIKDELTEVVSKYFQSAVSSEAHFKKENSGFTCHIIANEGSGRHLVIKGDHSAGDPYLAFEGALSKIENRLRKYKSRFKDRHDILKISQIGDDAVKYVIEGGKDTEIEYSEPKIIAEKSVDIRTLSLKDAVMFMELENLPALMFKNEITGKINVVYHRKDGNISWIDSK